MPYVLENLVVDRVDFVDEGANSAAFIKLFKRKEQTETMEYSEILSKLKPEHSSVVQQEFDRLNAEITKAHEERDSAAADLTKAREDLATANADLTKAREELEVFKSGACTCDGEADEAGVCKSCGKVKKSTGFDEAEVLKSMPESIRTEFVKMRAQKEAAEEQVRKAAEEKLEAEAVAKAATLKSLPVEQEQLVKILKGCDQSIIDVLSAAANAIDNAVLSEVGKSAPGAAGFDSSDAWSKIEAEADKVVARDSVTKQKAIATVIKEQPELYKEYLKGGNQ